VGHDYWSAAVVWHNVMLTARPRDALSSSARPGSSKWSPLAVPPAGAGPPPRIYRWEKTTAVAVKIKLKRLGKIREPYYRIVVADARTKRDGRAIEEVGKYHPKAEPSLIEVNSERVQHWLSVGAQPTDPVRVLLKITGDWQKFTGEPGTEGTLRTAEPRPDRKERFAAAAGQSQASKEARAAGQSKGQSRAAKPAKDSAAKDSAPKDSAPKDSAPKDSAPKDSAAQDSAAQDNPPKADAAQADDPGSGA
jgi:small subunit ribosomal protein S16